MIDLEALSIIQATKIDLKKKNSKIKIQVFKGQQIFHATEDSPFGIKVEDVHSFLILKLTVASDIIVFATGHGHAGEGEKLVELLTGVVENYNPEKTLQSDLKSTKNIDVGQAYSFSPHWTTLNIQGLIELQPGEHLIQTISRRHGQGARMNGVNMIVCQIIINFLILKKIFRNLLIVLFIV